MTTHTDVQAKIAVAAMNFMGLIQIPTSRMVRASLSETTKVTAKASNIKPPYISSTNEGVPSMPKRVEGVVRGVVLIVVIEYRYLLDHQ